MSEEQKRIKVLHVDDEPDFLALTKAFLEREYAEFSIDTATSAGEAVKLLKSGTYDVVVSDYKMPVMDGLEFLKTLRASGNTIPFIMFTGKGREEVAIEALNNGANGYLQKGADIKSMYGTLAHAIRAEVKKERAEESLQESEEKYRLITESTSDFISKTTFNLKAAFTYISPAITKVMGYEPEDLIGKSAFSFIHPDDKKNLIRLLKGYVSAKLKKHFVTKGRDVSETIEYRFLDKSGKWRYILSTANIIGDELLFVSRDITERKRMENTLWDAEERYRTTFEHTGTAMCVLEEDQTISLINNEFEKLSGCPREEIEGKKKWPEFVVKEDLERMKKYHNERRKEGGKAPTSYEFGFIDRKGNIKNIHLSIDVIPGTKKSVCSLMDLTKRKKAEEALRNAEQEKATILYSISELVAYQDTEMRVLWANRAAGESVGLAPEELIGRHCYEIWHQRSEPCVDCPVVRARETSQPQEAEMTTLDGRVWFVRGYPVQDANGDITGMVETTLEITERKRAEEALRESEQNFRDLVENSPDGVIIADEKGAHLFANQRAAEITGYSVDELQKITIKEMTLPEELDMYRERYRERIKGEPVPRQYERPIVRKDGTTVLTELTTTTTVWKGKVCGMVTIRDITERKRAEEALRESEERFRAIFEAAQDSIFIKDRTLKYTQVNPAMERLFALPASKLIGRTDEDLFSMEAASHIMEKDSRVLDGEIIEEEHIKSVKGIQKTFHIIRVPMHDSSGEVIGLCGIARDITDRKRAEEKLAKIVDSVDIPTFAINKEHKITHWNTAVESLTGVKREEVVGSDKQWVAFYAKRRPVMADLIIDEAPESEFKDWYGDKYKKSSLIEGAYEAVDFFPALGEEGKWLLFTVAPLRDSEGTIIGAIETLQDITERKQMEEALRESEGKYRLLSENSQDITYAINKNYEIVSAMGNIKGITGYTLDDVPDGDLKKAISAVVPEDIGTIIKLAERVWSGERKVKGEFRIVRRDGEVRWVEVSLFPLYDERGEIYGNQGILRDISEHKRVEDALRKSEQEYRSLVESTEDSVYLVDRDCRYLFVNEKHLSRIGMPKDQVMGKTYGEFHPEDETEEFAEIVERVFKTGKSASQEHISHWGNRDVLRTLSPVKDSEGRVTAVTVVSKDITERKQVEDEREQLLKELEAKNKELGKFTYTVSHDLRSPLVTIQGFTDMVQTDLAQNELEKAKDNLTFIDKAATKMDKLLSDTLELSRIGRMANPPEDVPFGEIVKEALEQTAEQIKSSGVEVSVAEDFPTVHVDRMRIAEVLVNLIVNSINYRGEQPHPKIEIGHRIDNGERVFFVRDNGIGIDPGQHEKVFDLFYQVDSGGKGTGAGLAIVKRIIEVHGGRIWIESEKGKECTVCFTLPVT